MRSMRLSHLLVALSFITSSASAHLNWTQDNALDSFQWAQYDFSGISAAPNIPVRGGFRSELNLEPWFAASNPATGTVTVLPGDGPYSFMGDAVRVEKTDAGPNAYTLRSTRRLDKPTSTNTNPGFIASPLRPDGVLSKTIEFWYRWPTPFVTTRFDVGIQSAGKIRVSRNLTTPSEDQYRLELVHGDFRAFPGFTNWADVDAQGDGEADLDTWHHVAVAITTPGFVFNTVTNHDEYLAGSKMYVWHNGHILGTGPNYGVDIAGGQVHEYGTIQIRVFSGRIDLDGLVVWDGDLSNDGTNLNPFSNGRGNGIESLLTGTATTVSDWSVMD